MVRGEGKGTSDGGLTETNGYRGTECRREMRIKREWNGERRRNPGQTGRRRRRGPARGVEGPRGEGTIAENAA